MKIFLTRFREKAYALFVVMCFGAISIFILASTMVWTSSTGSLNDSAIRHQKAVVGAEAATEKVISDMTADFTKQGAAFINGNLPKYRQDVPTTTEDGYWANYKFSNGAGGNNVTTINTQSNWASGTPLISQYEGLKGYAATYQIKANAQDLGATHQIIGAVQQDLQLALIPIFQFAIFYNMDLEINPGAPMTIGGRTHSNDNIYLQPGASLTFNGDVTGSGEIIFGKKPGDPTSRSAQIPTFSADHDSGVNSLNLPIGTANTPDAVHKLVEIPPDTEPVNSDLGKARFYNNSDLVIQVTDGGVLVHGAGLTMDWSSVSNFVNLKKSFYDQREKATIKVVEVDIAGLVAWNNDTANNPLPQALHRDINSIYVADLRTQSGGSEPGVRIVNGDVLPPLGLTISTPDPLYVKGNFNATGSSVGSSDTSNTKPAALMADSINILSASWSDLNSAQGMGSRTASSTTVNAAFLSGIVETGNGYYSGGVENFPRFLENWSGKTFTYNGSMVVLFKSQIGDHPWPGTGSVYNPPNRNWYFDKNFLDPNKLPPLCPSVRAVIRGQWANVVPNT